MAIDKGVDRHQVAVGQKCRAGNGSAEGRVVSHCAAGSRGRNVGLYIFVLHSPEQVDAAELAVLEAFAGLQAGEERLHPQTFFIAGSDFQLRWLSEDDFVGPVGFQGALNRMRFEMVEYELMTGCGAHALLHFPLRLIPLVFAANEDVLEQ